MASDEAVFDPIEDGRPHPSILLLATGALALSAGIIEIATGHLSIGIAHAVAGGALIVADRNRRHGWDRGYRAALDSFERSIAYIEERDDDAR